MINEPVVKKEVRGEMLHNGTPKGAPNRAARIIYL
jgi:hypothetical protein